MTVADIAPKPPLDAARPWPGLDAFSEALQGFFFGRGAEAEELFRRVRGETVTLLFGQSGLGKTSLLRAGLAPRLRAAAFLPVFIRLDYAESAPSPLAQVKAEFEREAAAAQAEATPIAADEDLWAYFHRTDRVLTSRAGEPLVPVLIFDQFEEMFTVGLTRETGRSASQNFLNELAGLIENRPSGSLEQAIETDPAVIENYHFDRQDYRIVIALREDFLAQLDSIRERAPLIGRSRLRLRRMSGRQGFDAVTKPAPGLIAPEVAEEILRFVGRVNPEDAFGPAAGDTSDGLEVEPALLSLVCRELNERRLALELDRITPDLLAGNRDSIIQSFYDTTLADQKPAVRQFIEDELLSESGFRESVSLERARHALAAADVPPDALNILVSRRLLRIEERLDVARVEIIHDVLTAVIRASRDNRRSREAQADAAKRETASRRRIMSYALIGVIVVAAMVSTLSAMYAFHQRTVAQRNLALATEAANSLVFDLAQKYRNNGIPAAVLEDILGRARQLQDQLASAGDKSPELQNGRAIALVETATTLETLGDTTRALVAARQAHDILQSLVGAEPENTQYTSNLAEANSKIGAILTSQGDLGGALVAYREQKTLVTRLTQKQPENAQWHSDLAASDLNVGDVLEAQGDFAGALSTYSDARSVMQQLVAQDPSDDQWQSGLAESDESIGSIREQMGDLGGALTFYSESLTIRRALAAKDPGNTQWQRYLSMAELDVGEILGQQSKYDEALAALRESQIITKALVLKDPSNVLWQRDLATRNYYLGSLFEAQGRPEEALDAYRDSAATMKALTEKDPENATWQFDFVGVQARVGNILARQGKDAEALAAYGDSLTICKTLVQKDPQNAKWQLMLASLQQAVGAALGEQGHSNDALVADRDALAALSASGATDSDTVGRQIQLQEDVALILEQQGNLADALTADQAAVSVARQSHSAKPDDAQFKIAYAEALGEESWLLMLNKRPQDALDRAQEASDLDPSLLFVQGNKADSLLLLGRYEDAKTIYLANKDKKMPDGSSFADAVRADFVALRKQGLDFPDMKRIEDLLAETTR